MSVIERMGTMDGQPAKIRHVPERRQTHIYWGGVGKPDGYGHNHEVIQNDDPDYISFARVNGRIVIDRSQRTLDQVRRRQAALSFADILRTSWRNAMRYWGMGG